MDLHAAIIEQIATAVTTLQDTIHGLSQRIDIQQAPQISTQEDTRFDMRAPPPPPSMAQMAPPPIPHDTPFVIQSIEVILPHAIVPVQTQMLKQLRVAEGMDVWD